MAQKVTLSAAVVCHKGCERENNEDNFFFNGDYMDMKDMDKGACIAESFSAFPQVYGVCDGMGGIQRGERASFIAASKMSSLLDGGARRNVKEAIEQYALNTSKLILEDAQKSRADNEGTTVSMIVFFKEAVYIANAGDSRIYRLREQQLEQLSQDHSWVSEQRQAGLLNITDEQARKHKRSNVITRYLGMGDDTRPRGEFAYQAKHTMQKGDRYLICSDGIWDLLSNAQISALLMSSPDTLRVAQVLASCALELGGKDNATALVIDVR